MKGHKLERCLTEDLRYAGECHNKIERFFMFSLFLYGRRSAFGEPLSTQQEAPRFYSTVQLPSMKAGHDLILAVPCSKSRLSIIDQFSDPRALGAFGVIYATLLEPAQTEIPPLENRVD